MNESLGFLLVVDDEELNRDLLSRRLELEGYRTLTAPDGPTALRLLGEHDFDAVLLDVMMPGQSGYEVLAEIRKQRSAPELPVLMVTAKTQNEDVVNAFEVGANDYITKPINFPVALARIKSHVAARKLSLQADVTRSGKADPLTGLANRVLFVDHLNAAVKAAREGTESCFAVLFLDLDRFKVINDCLGHLAGDELLVTAARRLESCLRSTDVVACLNEGCTVSRFGGDEFVVLLRGLRKPDDARFVADRILAALGDSQDLCGHEVTLSVSIGLAVATDGETSADDLLRDADTALYQAKLKGKSQWCLFEPSMRKQAVERLHLEGDLRRALERNEFELHYQPIVQMPSQDICGFEALLRWRHAERGLVSPAEFIPIAEEIGFIVELGGWVLEQACRQLRDWSRVHDGAANLFVSVNVSSKQFAAPGLIEHVQRCLKESGLDGRRLKLEITEGAIMTNPREAAATLDRLRELGISVSLDDFGTGYSSLSYLQNFKIDTLKIDRSFIARLGTSQESDEIVRTIVNLAHNLGIEVTAEGIEQATQHEQLNAIACDLGQGYLYSRPMPVAAVNELLQKQAAACGV